MSSPDFIIFCGPCGIKDRKGKKWCTQCEAAVCEDCEKIHRTSRKNREHKLISLYAYRKIEHVTNRLDCEQHKRKYDWFCITDKRPLCSVCKVFHTDCPDVLSITEAAKNFHSSTALNDLDESITKTITNLNHCLKDRDTAIKNLDKKEQSIKNAITETRKKINEYLDELEEKILIDMSNKYSECMSEYSRSLKELNITEKKLNNLKDQIIVIQTKKQHLQKKVQNQATEENGQPKESLSDVSIFLATGHIQNSLEENIESVKLEASYVKNYELSVEIHPFISRLFKELSYLGKVKLQETMAKLPFRELKSKENNYDVSSETDNLDFQLNLNHKFNIKTAGSSLYISSCIIRPNGNILIADYDGNKIISEYNEVGHHTRDIPVSSRPFMLTSIDSERIAVTFGKSKYLEVLHLKYNNTEKKINFGQNCWGVSHQNGKLYVIVDTKGVVVTDLTGTVLNTIRINVEHVRNLTVFKDRIYFTDWFTNTLHCCSKQGEDIWSFQDDSVVTPRGLSVDSNQNVFVVGLASNNLTLVQNDGQTFLTLLTCADGLNAPHTVNYCRETQVLLLCNLSNGLAYLCNIT